MTQDIKYISVRGACEHNLKNVTVQIPKHQLVAFTGVSGSGKSSLVFDTLYIESFRRFAGASAAPVYMMGNALWAKSKRPQYESLKGLPPALGLSQRQGVAGRLSTVGTISGISDLLRVYFAAFGDVFCKNCDIPLKALPLSVLISTMLEQFSGKKITIVAPLVERRKGAHQKEIEKFRTLGFSKLRFNDEIYDIQDPDLRIPIDAKKLNTLHLLVDKFVLTPEKVSRLERAVATAIEYAKGIVNIEFEGAAGSHKFNTKANCPQCGESAPQLDPRYFSHSSLGQCSSCNGTGVAAEEGFEDLDPCPECRGSRLSSQRSIVRVAQHTFEHLHQISLKDLNFFVEKCLLPHSNNQKSRLKVSTEAHRLLSTILKLGLGYLNLNRSGHSLAPGDLQRLRLASMLSNNLTGALYILDEPCQGLTQQEVKNLVQVVMEVVHKNASVVCVEHHPDFLKYCDRVFLMGPGAGHFGGEIVGEFLGKEFAHQHAQNYLKLKETLNQNTSSKNSKIVFQNISVRHLKFKEISINQGQVTLFRGRAGSGKSSFFELCLLPCLRSIQEKNESFLQNNRFFKSLKIDKDFLVNHLNDVRPGSMKRSSRRAVAAALECLDPLRNLFAHLPASQILGLTTTSHFSWNSQAGRCAHCEGRGYIELQQRYGAPVEMECEVCFGAKLTSKSLTPRFKGYNFFDVMKLSIAQARDAFENIPSIEKPLARAIQFGLGYVGLGQTLGELSGGELQRLTLTVELKRVQLTGSWFVLVHPGTGLHSPDIVKLGELMTLMTSKGASFVIIENREEFLPYAHQVLDLEKMS